MSQFFNTAAPTNPLSAQSGLEALLNGASSTNDAPEGLFSSIISAMNGDNSPKLADLIQIGSPNQTGEAWLNLQLGDASISLSAEALTTPMTPQSLLALAPDIIDTLNLDGMVDEGLNILGKNIGQTIETALEAKPPFSAPGNQNPLLSLQETAQNPNLLALQSTNALEAVSKSATELLASANQMTTATGSAISQLIEQNPQISALAKTILGQRETTLASPPTPAPTTTDPLLARDSLAAQLQSQMGTTQEHVRQNTVQNQPTQTATTLAATQNPANFATAMSQMPFVQTRQLPTGTTADPLMVAQNFNQPISTEQSTLFQPVKAAYQSPQVNLPHMAVAIARNLNAGNNNFQIRLDPAELGRVNIQLTMDDSGAIHAKMLVERPETLQLLQQDSRALERALTQAGLDGARANLEFFQKDNPFAGGQFDNPDDQNNPDGEQQDETAPETLTANYQGTVSESGVSLWI